MHGLGFTPTSNPSMIWHDQNRTPAPHAGLVLEPLPVGAWAMSCLCVLLTTKAVTFEQAMCRLTSDSIWLIVIAFFFAKVRWARGTTWGHMGT